MWKQSVSMRTLCDTPTCANARSLLAWRSQSAGLPGSGSFSGIDFYSFPQRVVICEAEIVSVSFQIGRGRYESIYSEIESDSPDLISAYWEHPGDVRPPGGESWHQVCVRVDRAIDALIAAHRGRDLIVVAHFGVILTQIQRALQLDTDAVFAHRIDNLSVTQLTYLPDGHWREGRINHVL